MLGLTVATDPAWAVHAAAHLDEVLIDHAHCELKAAANAIALVGRAPDDMPLVLALSALAEEEVQHFRQVCELLAARGLTLGAPNKDEYAVLLRRAAANLPARHDEALVGVDRLLVGALIEARSAERFSLLAEVLRERGEGEVAHPQGAHGDPHLHAFYKELFGCEARHYRTYVDLAVLAMQRRSGEERARALVRERLAALAELEGQLVQESAKAPRATIHG